METVHARSVLLATGGLGQVYRETTNPSVATGDGVAMAWRAGAALMDMEFVQFHPTALYVKGAPRFLLSEALRGEGAYLRNLELHRFMPKYHEMAELAPRDVVARAIAHELELVRSPAAVVYLDLTHLDADHIRKRFPRILSTCIQHNIDITADLIPVRPAAHYAMGGVQTDLDGRTTLPGLYAAGEVACTGVHGANRLASNSLLEGLVYGARAGATMREAARAANIKSRDALLGVSETGRCPSLPLDPEPLIAELRDLAWNKIGIVRDGAGLKDAVSRLEAMKKHLPAPAGRRACEAHNLQVCASVIARSALARLESRGAHYRTDYPAHDDAHFRKHTVLTP
jgi:L-aspartate oxidase